MIPRAAAALLGLMLVGLGWRLLGADGSLVHVYQMRQQVEQARADNERALQRNRALEAEVADLKAGGSALEERARQMLGMVRPDETFYLVVGGR